MPRTDPLILANLALLLLFPAAWAAPLFEGSALLIFGSGEVSVLGGMAALWEDEPVLAILVALFAIFIPYAKTAALAAVHFGRLGARALPTIEILGKLSMADVFLIALYIVAVKGVLVVSVETRWGLWLFTGCVLASMLISHLTKRRLR